VFAAVISKQIDITTDMDWIEVDSAFGGMAIYHRRALDKGQYIGIRKDGTEICEHVTLHRQIKEQGFKIFINPALMNGIRTNGIKEKMFDGASVLGYINRLRKNFIGRLLKFNK